MWGGEYLEMGGIPALSLISASHTPKPLSGSHNTLPGVLSQYRAGPAAGSPSPLAAHRQGSEERKDRAAPWVEASAEGFGAIREFLALP